MSERTTFASHDSLAAVQRSALERALVDGVDARRHFALAGALDAVRSEEGESLSDDDGPTPALDTDDVLPAALLSVAVVSQFEADRIDTLAPPSPWTPGADTVHPAVRRGARLALEWFDVSVADVAARAGVPETVLIATDG